MGKVYSRQKEQQHKQPQQSQRTGLITVTTQGGGYRKSTNKKTSRVEQGDYVINVRPITVGEERKGHMGQWGVAD